MDVISPPLDADRVERHAAAPDPGVEIIGHHELCFACGVPPNGMGLRFVAEEGPALLGWFTPNDRHLSAPGITHGGLLSGVLDESFGRLAVVLRKRLVTGQIHVNYVRPVPEGRTAYVTVRADAQVGRRVYASGEVRLGTPEGELVVTARALCIVVGQEHFDKYR